MSNLQKMGVVPGDFERLIFSVLVQTSEKISMHEIFPRSRRVNWHDRDTSVFKNTQAQWVLHMES